MAETVCLDPRYSTTRRLTKKLSSLQNDNKSFDASASSTNQQHKIDGGLRTKGYYKQTDKEKPLLSIITVVYNGEKYLEQTVQSVIGQSYDNVEYIVVDGASTDATVKIIQRYEDQIDYWLSEQDKGIYDAMNKGVSLAMGDYVAFINADDWYQNGALSKVAKLLATEENAFLFANIDLYEHNTYIKTFRPLRAPEKPRTMPFAHPSLFVRKELMERYPFDLAYPIIADFDFVCKLLKMKFPFLYLDQTVANFRLGGVSSSNINKELFAIQYKHFGLLSAIYSSIRFSKTPLLSTLIKAIVKIKHRLFPFKDALT